MVRHLPAPERPLAGGNAWTWRPRDRWVRIYHQDTRTPTADSRRTFGPLLRFDPHTPPPEAPAECPEGRSVLYAAKTLRTAGAEVFGDVGEAAVCPRFRAAVLRPSRPIVLQDVQGTGSMLIGALPALGTADLPRAETQAWARAIHDDRPASPRVTGIRYSGAHDEGASIAVWEAAAPLIVVQDLPMVEPPVFRRFLVAMREVGIPVVVVDAASCRRCSRGG